MELVAKCQRESTYLLCHLRVDITLNVNYMIQSSNTSSPEDQQRELIFIDIQFYS